MGRRLDIDRQDSPGLDARAIVLGSCAEPTSPTPIGSPTPAVIWEGNIAGDGTGPQQCYFVRLYDNGTAHCQCPAFYFRGVLRRDTEYACKHVHRARAAAQSRE
jgi:hypothetical protein